MLKIKIASVLVAGTLLLGGCASKSPANIDKSAQNNNSSISQVANSDEAKANEVQNPQTSNVQAPSQQNNPQQSNPTNVTTSNVASQSAPKTVTQTSNNIQSPTYNKANNAAQNAPQVVSQNGVEYLAAVEDEVLRLCNIERSKAGLAPLVMDAKVREAGRFKAQEMLTKNYFDHNSPYSGTPFDLMKNRGIQFGYAGENIQMSEGKDKAQVTAQYLVTNWMNSPGHRANILNGNFKKMGIGVAFSANGNKAYESQLFTD